MTTLLTTQDVALTVAAHGLPEVLRRMVAAIEADFRRWPEFDKVARLASHSREGVIELMPVADATHYSFKYVNGHPANGRFGLPTVMAFGVLAEVATGRPTLLSELTLTTAMRTAATSVMAAKLLARPGSRTMALIGNGAQSEFQALAFHHLLGITTLRLFDTDPGASLKLERNLARLALPGLTVERCASTAEAVRGCDLWIVDALRWTPHPTHAHVDKTLDWIARAQVKRAVLTNLHLDLDYNALKAAVPAHVDVAHDGWSARLSL